MKRLLTAGQVLLLLLLLLLCGCARTDGSAPIISTEAAPSVRIETTAPASAAVTTEEALPTATRGGISGVEMELPAELRATPGCPWVTVTIRFPAVPADAETGEPFSLTLYVDDELAAEWPELALSPGLEKHTELEFEFNRFQEDRIAQLRAELTRGEECLVRSAVVEVDNYPEELYDSLRMDLRPYSIDVIRDQNVVIVYGRNGEGEDYSIPVKVWLCSTGENTPTGDYSLGPKREWGRLFGGVFGQYISRITGDILFHSVPYLRMEKDSLEAEEYNKLGSSASMGCIRLAAGDVKWIYDNCPMGTPVHIFDADTLPVERPEFIPLDLNDPRSGWDPTDPDPENPWNQDN